MTRKHTNPLLARPRQADRLEEIYIFRQPSEVREILEEYPFLIPLLFEAHPQIGKHFGSDAPIFLEVFADPEATDDRELFAMIGTRLGPEEALKQLDQFDKEWWLKALDRAQCKLCIHIEFL